MYVCNIHFSLRQSNLDTSKTQCMSLEAGKMHRASVLGSGVYLVLLRGFGGGGNRFRLSEREELRGG